MENLVLSLKRDYPDLTFVEGALPCWSPEKREIYYDPKSGDKGIGGVLHEIGHARLRHTSYESDMDLLKKESEAWQEALTLAAKYGVTLDQANIQDCIDTYREWLYKRSSCRSCGVKGLQRTMMMYHCFNCDASWHISPSRFCRPYRLSVTTKKAG